MHQWCMEDQGQTLSLGISKIIRFKPEQYLVFQPSVLVSFRHKKCGGG